MIQRWYLDLFFIQNVCRGRVYQIPESSLWQSYGMQNNWQDTDLGTHKTREKAKAVIQDWLANGMRVELSLMDAFYP